MSEAAVDTHEGNMKLRSIVCGIDFSAASVAGLDLALMLARVHGARVRAVHAYNVPTPPYLESGIVVCDEERLAGAALDELRALIAGHTDGSVPIEQRAAPGWPAPAILREAHDAQADLVIVGTRGLTGLPRFLLGGVAERVARTAHVPVLVVPEPRGAEPPRAIRTIACGLDFSEHSALALRYAASLASAHGAELSLVHAWEPPSVLAHHEALAAEHDRELERALQAEARKAGLDPSAVSCAVRRGTSYAVIVEHAREVGADLVALGSTGRSGPRHFLLGSVAERVMRASSVPVLVVR